MILKNVKDIKSLVAAVKKCKGDVVLRSVDGKEEFNLKSQLSQYIAIGKLCEERGNEYEIFCLNRGDEVFLFEFFHKINK